jgi:hypothetical protein
MQVIAACSGQQQDHQKELSFYNKAHPNGARRSEQWFRREDALGVEKGLGSLWEIGQPHRVEMSSEWKIISVKKH